MAGQSCRQNFNGDFLGWSITILITEVGLTSYGEIETLGCFRSSLY